MPEFLTPQEAVRRQLDALAKRAALEAMPEPVPLGGVGIPPKPKPVPIELGPNGKPDPIKYAAPYYDFVSNALYLVPLDAFEGETNTAAVPLNATAAADPDFPPGTLIISLWLPNYPPNHTVTLRTSVDGASREILGTFEDGHWFYELPWNGYPDTFQAWFVLNGTERMQGASLNVDKEYVGRRTLSAWRAKHAFPRPAIFGGNGDVVFSEDPASRFRHDISRLRTEDCFAEQNRFHASRGTATDYDVIVVGSGMAGGVVANELSNAGKRVLLLETGRAHFLTHVSNQMLNANGLLAAYRSNQIVKTGPKEFWDGANFVVGGRSIFWSGVIPRIMDFEYSFWPNEVATALRDTNQGGGGYYTKAEAMMRKADTLGEFTKRVIDYCAPKLTGMHVGELPFSFHQPNARTSKQWHPSSGMFNTADLLSDSREGFDPGHKYLSINTGHMAIELTHVNGRITGVVCEDLVGRRRVEYRGRFVVLAGGCIESAKLALASNLNDPSNLAGVGYTDHPTFTANPKDSKGDEYPWALTADSPFAGQEDEHAKLRFIPRAATMNDKGFYAEVTINPLFWHPRVADPAMGQGLANYPGGRGATVKFYTWSYLNDNNRITSRGPGQRAKLEYHGHGHPDIDATKGKQWTFKNKLMKVIDPNYDEKIDVDKGYGIGTIQHAVGSLRMASPLGPGVVDTNHKFLAYANLYVADGSVFPYVQTPNPSLTIVALALRLADHLKNIV